MGISEPSLRQFIDEQIASGRHASAHEVVEAALRLYRDAQEDLDEHDAMVRREAERGRAAIAAGDFVLIEDRPQLSALLQRNLDELERATTEPSSDPDG